MTISAVNRFTGLNKTWDERQEIGQWLLKGCAYMNDNTDATVTVLRHISGRHARVITVEEWDSMAAYEASWQELSEDPEWRSLFNEGIGNISDIHVTFYNHEGP